VEVAAAGSAAAAERALERAAGEGRPFQVMLVDADLGAGVPAPHVPAQRRPSVAAPASPQAAPAALTLSAGQSDGIALIGRVRAAHAQLRVIVLATTDDPHRAVRALQAGAGGWVAKESSLGRLMAVIRGVARDETHLPPSLLTGVIRELTAARRDRTESERLVETLTPREKQVLRCMVAGLGRQAVADRLYLSPHTVRTHMQNVLGKLGVHSTLAAVALARRAGVGPADC
jgi:DNA-binding NarL/FixJ family response regulator